MVVGTLPSPLPAGRCVAIGYRGRRSSGEWRNWQTRRIQVPVSERMWGFKSPLAHEKACGPAAGKLGPSMGLQQFERRLERLVEGVFAKAFRSGLEPVEVGRRMAREMDRQRQ